MRSRTEPFVGYLIKSYQSFGFKVAGNLPNAGQILSVPDMGRLDFIKISATMRCATAWSSPW